MIPARVSFGLTWDPDRNQNYSRACTGTVRRRCWGRARHKASGGGTPTFGVWSAWPGLGSFRTTIRNELTNLRQCHQCHNSTVSIPVKKCDFLYLGERSAKG